MEEDIKILKELVANEHGELLNCWDYGEEAKKAIENIIARLEQDERVIEEMAKELRECGIFVNCDNNYVIDYYRKKCE